MEQYGVLLRSSSRTFASKLENFPGIFEAALLICTPYRWDGRVCILCTPRLVSLILIFAMQRSNSNVLCNNILDHCFIIPHTFGTFRY